MCPRHTACSATNRRPPSVKASASMPPGWRPQGIEMKVAVIRSECSYRKGGAERYAANLCRSLVELGHEVWVLAEKFDADIHPALIHIPIQVDRSSSWSRNRSFNRNSQKALAGLEVDAVLALSRSFPSDAFRVSDPLHRYWMKVRYPGKLHRFLQTLNPRHRAILELENAILDPANTRMIITNSRLSKTIIREYYDYPEDRIHVIYNGVDLDKFRPAAERPPSSGPVRLLFVGQDFQRKGLGTLIEALALLEQRSRPCTLRVIGSDNPAPYRKLAARLGVADLITFAGASKEIHTAYQEADLFVFPTFYDPFANVCLESLACGLPALTTTTNGSSEIITDGIDGYVISGEPFPRADSIAAKVAAYCGLGAQHRDAMRTAARETALTHTIEANARRVAELLSGKEVPRG
ncbi:MAG: glycosyltransferase family 1 protein [Verrucomicrobiaceae bacterium]|nr:MAG: glycosyltransferase family 1 protein [Verrucomicrobiaceae bacterium]